jgi:nucleoside-diphosphate-sugar epimerase
MKLLKNCYEKNQQLDLSEGNQLLDLVHVDDVVNAFIRAYEILLGGTIINKSFGISSGNVVSLRQLIILINDILGKELPVTFGSRPYRNREVMIPWNSFETLPGWHPKITLETGVKLFLGIQ